MTDGENRLAAGPLKIDRRGRVRSTVAQRQAVLAEFERSGLSGPQFARVAGIAYQTFGNGGVQRLDKKTARTHSVRMDRSMRKKGRNAIRAVASEVVRRCGHGRWTMTPKKEAAILLKRDAGGRVERAACGEALVI